MPALRGRDRGAAGHACVLHDAGGADRVADGDVLACPEPEEIRHEPDSTVRFDVLWEDDVAAVVDKPAGLVVHPGAGNARGTLMNGLLAHAPQLETLPRAGIVHRLDKDTSGLLLVANGLGLQWMQRLGRRID